MKTWMIITGLSLFLMTALVACTASPAATQATPDVPATITAYKLPPVSAFTWETYSDAAGSFTMDIPDYWVLDSNEVDPDGKSSLTRWIVRNVEDKRLFGVEVRAEYNEDGWAPLTSETLSKQDLSYLTNFSVPRIRTISSRPASIQDGWAYTVTTHRREGRRHPTPWELAEGRTQAGSQPSCAARSTRYFDIRLRWAYRATVTVCVGENITYYLDGRTAIFSLTPTPYGRR